MNEVMDILIFDILVIKSSDIKNEPIGNRTQVLGPEIPGTTTML